MGVPVLVRPFLRTGFHPAFTPRHSQSEPTEYQYHRELDPEHTATNEPSAPLANGNQGRERNHGRPVFGSRTDIRAKHVSKNPRLQRPRQTGPSTERRLTLPLFIMNRQYAKGGFIAFLQHCRDGRNEERWRANSPPPLQRRDHAALRLLPSIALSSGGTQAS